MNSITVTGLQNRRIVTAYIANLGQMAGKEDSLALRQVETPRKGKGAAGETRTPDARLRTAALYPTELQQRAYVYHSIPPLNRQRIIVNSASQSYRLMQNRLVRMVHCVP